MFPRSTSHLQIFPLKRAAVSASGVLPVVSRLVLVLSLAATPIHGERLRGEGLTGRISSVALDDDASAVFLNPAAAGLATRWDLMAVISAVRDTTAAAARTVGTARVEEKRRRITGGAVQFRGLGVGYERLSDGALAGSNQWRFTAGLGLRRGMRFGLAAMRVSARESSTWRYRAGALLRPHDALSLGATVSDLTQSDIAGRRLRRSYHAGVGLRPLPGALRERLTLFTDLEALEKSRWRTDAALTAGIQAEPLAGILITAGASGRARDPLDDPAIMAALSVQFATTRIEGLAAWEGGGGRERVSSFALHHSHDRARTLAERRVTAEVTIRGALADEGRRAIPLPVPFLGAASRTSVAPILERLHRARDDPSVRGVLLRIGPVSGGGLLDEIREAIDGVRSAGKPVIAHLEDGGSHNGYGLAAACDEIVLAPGSALYLLGLRSDILYYGEALDSLGIGITRVTSGRYKTAYERFERSSASPGFREQMESLLDERWSRWVEIVARGRGLAPDTVEALADGRVILAREARRAGLVDSVATLDAARRRLADLTGVDGTASPARRIDRWRDRRTHWGPRPVVAVYHMNGFVDVGPSRRPLIGRDILGAETVRRDLQALGRDPSVAAVVLRVESGGGLGLGGTVMREAVRELRAAGKPVVVSVGRLATSAAYHVSAAADRIVASPGSYTGSIGVLIVRPDQAGLLARLRIHPETFERGDLMGLWTLVRPLTEEERRLAQGWIREAYDDFVGDVASDRGMSLEEVREVAAGRVWTGRQALERGLVDELGGLEVAIARARALAGLEKDATIRHIRRPQRGILGRLLQWAVAGAGEDPGWAAMPVSGAVDPSLPANLFPGTLEGRILPLEFSPVGEALADE